MPSGNGCRTAMQRAKNAAKAEAAGKKSTAETRAAIVAAGNAIQCQQCMTGFSKNANAKELRTHYDNKHTSKAKCGKSFSECFPGFNSDDDE